MTELRRALDKPVAGLVFDEDRKAAVRQMAFTKRVRRPVRRAVVALALCAALAATAAAAGPSIRQALEAWLGAFAPYLSGGGAKSVSAGIELEVVGAISDGASAQVYLTAHDNRGGRLDGHTGVVFDVGGAAAQGAAVLAFDEASDTLLLELEAINLTGEKLTLSGGTLTPNSYQVSVEPELADGLAVSQTYGELPGFSTSMGFDGENNFHLRVKLDEEYSLSACSVAFVTFSDGSTWFNRAEQVSYLSDGQDLRLEGVTRENWAQVEKIWLVTSYTGPLEPITGDWKLTVDTEAAEGVSTPEGFSLALPGGGVVTSVSLSPLGVVAAYTGEAEALPDGAVRVTLADGSRPDWGKRSVWNWGGDGYVVLRFTRPVELEDISSVTIQGVEIPLG